jgi:uncharacterized protein (DUF427 family)
MSESPVLEAAGVATDGLVHLERHDGVVEVWSSDRLLASSARVIELHEVDVPTRLYFPRDDVRLDELRPIDKTTFCPFKGVANAYWALAGSSEDEPVAWSYPDPISAFSPIGGHIAFYDSVDISPVG